MKQFKLTFLLTVLMSMVGTRTMADEFTVDGICYYICSEDMVWLTSGSSCSGDVVIPETVTYNNVTYTVIYIGPNAFEGCSLTSVTLPDNVEGIGEYAFSGCSNLTSVTFGNNTLWDIGSYAFSGCSNLTSVNLGNIVVYEIGTSAFSGCSSLTSINIPNSVQYIGDQAFYECSGLTSVTIGNSVTSIGDEAFTFCSSLTSVTIGDGVISIGYNAFGACSNLTSITLPNSLTSIGNNAFYGCISLASVTFGNNLTNIEGYAFCECHSLTSITLPNSVTSIGHDAFYNCENIENFILGNGVINIGDRAFSYCWRLTSINIPNSVKSIGEESFSGCSSLTSITIPNNVTNIGKNAFSYCSGLTSIVVGSNNTIYDSRNNCNAIIETASNTLILGCDNTIIPNNVTGIGDFAFYECGFTSVIIPNSVTSIGREAFYYCSNLASITLPNSVTSIGCGAFDATAWYYNQPNGLIYAGKVAYCYKGTMPANTNIVLEDGTLGIAGGAFSGCGSSLTSITIPNSVMNVGEKAFVGCSSLTSISIPNSVTSISEFAFLNCSGLTSISIPNSVTSIGGFAFLNCNNLTSVTVERSVPVSISYGTFSNCANATLYVPYGSKTKYEAANYWKQFKEIVEMDMETTDISTLDNVIYAEEATALKGGNGTLTICLKNSQATNAYSFDMTLPEGVTIDSYTLSNRHNGHSESMNYNETTGVYSFAVLSSQSKEVTGNDGAIWTFKLNVADNVEEGGYPVKITNARYSLTSGSASVTMPETTSLLTIADYLKGDVNNDGDVDIADAVCIVNHAVGKNTPVFIAAAADVNNDGDIDIADAVRIINLVVGKIDALSRSTEMEWDEREPQ